MHSNWKSRGGEGGVSGFVCQILFRGYLWGSLFCVLLNFYVTIFLPPPPHLWVVLTVDMIEMDLSILNFEEYRWGTPKKLIQ